MPQGSEFGEARASSVGRVPPSDVEAEKAVLSALLLDNDAIHTVLSEVRPTDFYHPAHQKIYESMLLMQDANDPVDLDPAPVPRGERLLGDGDRVHAPRELLPELLRRRAGGARRCGASRRYGP